MNALLVVNDSIRDRSDSVINQITQIANKNPEDQEEWLKELGKCLSSWGGVAAVSKLQETKLLYHAKLAWDGNGDVQPLSEQAKRNWNCDFYKYVNAFLIRDGEQPAPITIHNLISVWEDWNVKKEIEYPATVLLPKRDDSGNIVNIEEFVEVPFNPEQSTYSKLLVARARARNGELSPSGWAALMDTKISIPQLKSIMSSDAPPKTTDDKEFYVFYKDGVLFGVENGDVVAAFRVVDENTSNHIGVRTIEFILKSLGIQPDKTILQTDNDLPVATCVDDGIVINKWGTRFGKFSEQEILDIEQVINEYFNR